MNDHVPPRSASSTLPPASLRSARTVAFAGSLTTSVSFLPFGSLRYSDVPRWKMIVPPAKSSSARAAEDIAARIASASFI